MDIQQVPYEQPQVVPVPQPPKKSGGCTKPLIIVIIISLILCCTTSLFVGATLVFFADKGTQNQDDKTPAGETKSEDPKFDDVKVSVQVESIYNDNINPKTVNKLEVYELKLGLAALKLLQKTSWNGDKDAQLPISYSDFDQQLLKDAIADEKEDQEAFTIDNELLGLFTTSTAQQEIKDVIYAAHDEYIQYLKDKGVAQKYINEITTNTFPKQADRIYYHADNNPDSPYTAMSKYEGGNDYSKRQLDMYDIDVHLEFEMLRETKVLGEEPINDQEKVEHLKKIRNMAVRYLTYHEMTHVLQTAYVALNVDAAHKGDKSAYIYADKTLIDIDDQYYWEWGGKESLQMSNNRDISQESQADGIAFEMLTTVYNMSPKQKEVVWERLFGRFDDARDELNQIRTIAESNYPTLVVSDFGEPLADVFTNYPGTDASLLRKISKRLTRIPAYVGYMNPMLPQDTHKLWDAVKN